MKLHGSAIEKLVYLMQTYGGKPDESVLKKYIAALDFTPYERKTSGQEMILVLTEDYLKALNQKG